jgi:Tfp pilus assembly protein PilF
MGRMDSTKKSFGQCSNIPEYAPFYIARGLLFEKSNTTGQNIEEDFKRAVKLDPDNWRAWFHLSNYFFKEDSLSQGLETARKAYQRLSHNQAIGINYAKALIYSERFREALKILSPLDVLPSEHSRNAHNLFELANLSLAMKKMKEKQYKEAINYLNESEKWPEHLGVGKPYDPDIRLQNYIAAYCESKLGNSKEHQQLLDKMKNYTLKHWTHYNHGPTRNAAGMYIGAKTLEKSGHPQKAHQLLDRWKVELDSLKYWRISGISASHQVQWVFAKFNDKEKVRRDLEAKIQANKRKNKFQIFLEALKIINPK